MRLDDCNYLIWSQRIKHVALVYGLQNFLDGFEVVPEKKIKKLIESLVDVVAKSQEELQDNPEFEIFDCIDKPNSVYLF